MFTLDELIQVFDIENIVKSGARFDIDKALWFNQHYIIQSSNEDLAKNLLSLRKIGYQTNESYLLGLLLDEREVHKIDEMITSAMYFSCHLPRMMKA